MTEGVLASFRTRSDESILDFDRMDKFEVQKKVVEFKGLFKTLELLLELRWKLGLSDHTCVIEGLIALDDGRLKAAIQCLDGSTMPAKQMSTLPSKPACFLTLSSLRSSPNAASRLQC